MRFFQTSVGIAVTDSGWLRIAAVRSGIGGFTQLRAEDIADFERKPEAEKREHVLGLAARFGLPFASVFLTLPRTMGVSRSIELPVEAADRATSAAALQIESLCPWTVDEVYWDCVVEKPAKQARSVRVRIEIVPQAVLDPWLRVFRAAGVAFAGARLADASTGPGKEGIAAAMAGFERHGTGINVIPAATRFHSSRWQFVPTCVLVAALLLLGTAFLLREPYQWSVHGAAVESEIALLKPEVDAVAAREEAFRKATADYEALRARVETRDLNLEALRELARVLPSDTWISGYSAQGRVLTVTGFAASASAIQKTLEESALFAEAQFASPVTRDPSGKDRFSIKMTIEAGR
jgi:Tfp pilus assembly protein PilN